METDDKEDALTSETVPVLTYSEAEDVGGALHDRWHDLTGAAPAPRDDFAWADLVQLVVRKARERVAMRAGE